MLLTLSMTHSRSKECIESKPMLCVTIVTYRNMINVASPAFRRSPYFTIPLMMVLLHYIIVTPNNNTTINLIGGANTCVVGVL